MPWFLMRLGGRPGSRRVRGVEPLQPGDPEFVGRYRMLGRLGAGGMGRVYLGATPDGGQAAIKVIRDDLADDTRFRHRFRREVAAASAVAGMFTARVLDADPDADPPWLATQYVEGPSLSEAIRRHGPMPEDRLVALAQGIAEALAAIHAAGLIHRDLKPANVILSPGGPKVIDFGIARAADSTQLTGTGQIVGTPDYMAPEQIEGTGESGPPGDVFALGSTLVHAATGRGPFAAEQTAATLYRILNAEPDLQGVPPRIAAFAAACLAKDPARRPTAVQLAVALRSPAATGAMGLSQQGSPDVTRSPSRRRGLVAVAVGVAVALAVAATVAAVSLGRPGGGTPAAATTTAVAASTIDPNGPEARYVDRLCTSGNLLSALGDVAATLKPTGDPVVAKRDFLAVSDQTISAVDGLLAVHTVLRDEAPTDDLKTKFGLVVDEFTSAKAAYMDARTQVAASEPLSVAVYTKAVDRFGDGTRNLSYAATLIKAITLPRSYTDASAVAPHCKQ
jgi:serine/threonine protein kinase